MILNILQAFLLLSVFLLSYNLGWTLGAKLFGMRIERFAIWFDTGFALIRFKWRGIEFVLGWIPLGSYVKIAGMQKTEDEEPQPYHFYNKPLYQRMLTLALGPVVGLVISLCCFGGLGFQHLAPFALYLVAPIGILISFGWLINRINSFLTITNNWLATLLLLVGFGGYLALFYAFLIPANDLLPFKDFMLNLATFNYGFTDLIPLDSSTNRLRFIAWTGLTLYFMNLLPVSALNGGQLFQLLFTQLTGLEEDNKFLDRLSLVGFFFWFAYIVVFIYHLF